MVKRPKRWLILTQYYAPEIGAPQIRLRSLAWELKRKGFDVEVLTAMPNYPSGEIFPGYKSRWRCVETVDGIKVRRRWVYAATGKSAFGRLANYLSFTFMALGTVLFSPKPDVLFIEGQPLTLGIVGLMLKWLRKVPYIFNVPDLQIQVARQLGFMNNHLMLTLALKLEKAIIQNSWSVSTVTYGLIEYFTDRGLPQLQVSFLPNGADADFLVPSSPDVEMLERWHLQDKRTFIYIGTLSYYQGLETLIHAAALLQKEQDIAFLIVGDGSERARLMQLATELGLQNIIFALNTYEEMARLYSIAFASVVTLRKMEFSRSMRPSKIFPSMSCGVPIIFAGDGETADLLREHRCGIVTEPEQSQLLADNILRLVNDPALRDEMGHNGRLLVEREYAWSVIVRRWLDELGIEYEKQR